MICFIATIATKLWNPIFEENLLQVAAFRGGRGKIDDLYNRDIDKNVKVKSLLSTMLMNGLDV